MIMRQFQTSTLEQRRVFDADFETHPLEVAWASEAIFFVDAEQLEGAGSLLLKVQISVDGVNWLDEGTAFDPISGTTRAFRRVSHFGGWLRLQGIFAGAAHAYKLTIHLVIKE